MDADSDLQTQLYFSLDSETASHFSWCHCHSTDSATARRCGNSAWCVGSYVVEGLLSLLCAWFMPAAPINSSSLCVHRSIPCSMFGKQDGGASSFCTYPCEKQVSPGAVSCEDCGFCSATGSLEHSTSPWFGSQLYITLPRQQRGIAVAVSPEQRPWSYRYNDKSRLPSQYLHWQQLMCNTEIHSPAITGKKKVNKTQPFPLKLSLTLLPFLQSWTRIALLFLQSDPPGTVLSVRRLCWTEGLYFSLVINLKTFT